MEFNKLGLLVDIGVGLKKEDIVQEGVAIGEKLINLSLEDEYKFHLHYNLANGYFSLYNLYEYGKNIEIIPLSKNLQKAKSHFRESTKFIDDFNCDYKKRFWVNYGNCLDCLGRGVEALYSYDNALKIDPNFSMAVGNKAKALCFFADISGKYKTAIYIEAYQLIKSIINNNDLIEVGTIKAKCEFENELVRIESLFKDKNILSKKLKHSKYDSSNLSDFEKFYLEFSSKNKLFLNFHIHQDQCEAAVVDPVFIRLIRDVEDNDTFYRLARYINQIKESYSVARLLLVQSQYKRKDFDNISRRTTLINTLDYSQFNLYGGLLKSAFKEGYNILDKIAVFINDYYKLELKENRTYFKSIWKKDKKIRDKILKSENINLYALYDIFQDFESGYYEKIKNIRNALTHRNLTIFDFIATTERDKKGDKYNIGYEEMLTKTIELLQLTKSAIIYLINFVNSEENRKHTNKTGIMHVDTSQFL